MPLPTYLMSNFPSVRPSLNLQFDSQPTPEDMTSHLASVGATFSRASIGTYVDANGIIQEATSGQARPNYSTAGVHEGLLIEESRTNLVESSEDFSTTDWTLLNTSVIINQEIAPDGKASADKLIENTTNNAHAVRHAYTFIGGTSYTLSIFLKEDERTKAYVAMGGATFGGLTFEQRSAEFNLSSGTIISSSMGGSTITPYKDGWYLCSATVTPTTTDAGFFDVYISDGSGNNVYTGDGTSGIYIWGAQLEEGSFPTSYIPTIPTFSSRASDGTYFDSSGVLQTASTDEERIDHKYIDGQWVEAGLLLEGSATNLLPYSTGTTGYSTSGTGTYTSTASGSQSDLAGGTDAVRWEATVGSTSSDRSFFRDCITIASTDIYTLSFFAKSYDGNDYKVKFHYGGGSQGSVTITDRWQRFEYTGSVTSGNRCFGVEITGGTVTSDTDVDILVYGFQLEQATQSSSYIATSGGTADRSEDLYNTNTKVRSADVCYIDGTAFTDFYNDDEGTMLVNGKTFNPNGGSGNAIFGLYDENAPSNQDFVSVTLETSNDEARIRGNIAGAGTGGTVIGDYTNNTFSKIALYLDSNAHGATIDGGTVADDTETFSGIGINKLWLGYYVTTGEYINGAINKLIYFPRRLGSVGNNAELIKLTQ